MISVCNMVLSKLGENESWRQWNLAKTELGKFLSNFATFYTVSMESSTNETLFVDIQETNQRSEFLLNFTMFTLDI